MASNDKKDLLVMKFLHYFITEKNYNPVIVHGIENEIWLENMDNDIKIVRIVTGYIHNMEQLEFDSYKVQRLTKQIKLKTFTFNMKTLSLYLDLNDDVNIVNTKKDYKVKVKNEKSIKNNKVIQEFFEDMPSKLKFTEQGALLYQKINTDIMNKNIKESRKINDLFKPKKPIITYILIAIMSIIMVLMYFVSKGSVNLITLYKFGALIKKGSILRLIISIFLHAGIIHLVMNIWALKILGTQTENFYGHIKTLIIFIYSGIIGNLISLLFMSENTISVGASGAIFGLMGAILYFAINQRTYIGEALKKEILPVIIINILLGFMITGINVEAHLGGLIGGILISNALGIKYKTSKSEKINGFIASIILVIFLVFLVYFK